MIRIKFKELIAEKSFRDKKIITIAEIAAETGIHRATLSKIAHEHGCNTGTWNINKLCEYFECNIQDILVYIPDSSCNKID